MANMGPQEEKGKPYKSKGRHKELRDVYAVNFYPLYLCFLQNFKSSFWLTRFMKVILLMLSLFRIKWGTPNLYCGSADVAGGLIGVSSTCVHKLVHRLEYCLKLYNCSKHSVCTASINKMQQRAQFCSNQQMLEKKVPLISIIRGPRFLTFQLQAKMSELGHFRCFPTAHIYSKRTWVRCYSYKLH